MKSIVLDTNIFIAALLKSKHCAAILEAIKQDTCRLLTTEKLIDEFLMIVENPRFEFREEDKQEAKEFIREKAECVYPSQKVDVCRDPEDNMVLECALEGKADFVVTRDKDLLSLRTFKNIRIITPHKFTKRLEHL